MIPACINLNLYMYKQKNYLHVVNNRNARTRAHDAPLVLTVKPNNEMNKRDVYYKGVYYTKLELSFCRREKLS